MRESLHEALRLWKRGIEAPWRIENELLRLVAAPTVRLRFRLHGIARGTGWRVFGMPIIQRHAGSSITIGDRLTIRSWRSSNPLAPHGPVVLATRERGAVLSIGDDCGITGGAIVAASEVCIGNGVLIGANSVITDTDFHPLDPRARLDPYAPAKSAPVSIGDGAFIGMHSIVLKGASIGENSVVGAGSVVSGAFPANSVIAGNPARVVRSLDERDGVAD